MDTDKLLNAAYKGVVNIKFKHYRTGEELCSNYTLLATPTSLKQQKDNGVLAFFDTVGRRWETIDVKTITDWKIIE